MNITGIKDIFSLNSTKATSSRKYPNLSPLAKDTVSFSGNIKTQTSYVRELSDEEYDEYFNQILKKFQRVDRKIAVKDANFNINKYNIFLFDKIISNERLYANKEFMSLAQNICNRAESNVATNVKCSLIDKILGDERLYNITDIWRIVQKTDSEEELNSTNIIIDKFLSDKKIQSNKELAELLPMITSNLHTKEAANLRCDLINTILDDEELCSSKEFLGNAVLIISLVNRKEEAQIAKKILSDKRLYGSKEFNNPPNKMFNIIYTNSQEQANARCALMDKIISDKKLYENKGFMQTVAQKICDCRTEKMANLECKILDKILSDKRLYDNDALMKYAGWASVNFDEEQVEVHITMIDKILSDKRLYDNKKFMEEESGRIIYRTRKKEQADKLCKILDDKELTLNQAILLLISKEDEISCHKLKELNKLMGMDKASKLSIEDTKIACNFLDIYNKQSINEISIRGKKELLRSLVASNDGLFNISDEMKKYFPLIPTSKEEYCTLLPSIVRSLGIETNVLDENEVSEFNYELFSLSSSLASISDDEFNNLEIEQEYSKDDFIGDTLSIVKDMDKNERQKVYDYFGFELHRNKYASYRNNRGTGFSIVGYPVNLNNGKKLAMIDNPDTKRVIEQLRPYVIKFSEDNRIKSNNATIEEELNSIVKVLPELRTSIGNIQGNSHSFDIMKHSLKVMQKIAQDSKFDELSDSDKKIMLLGALLHDLTKFEGMTDKTHAYNSSFDAYFIAKKFNLNPEEENKLYSLIKNHEWLNYVNTSEDEKQLEKRLQSCAYDLRFDNRFDMALMFAHADLRAVANNDSFHDGTVYIDKNGDEVIRKGRRSKTDNTIRSFGDSADYYAGKIREYIKELKTSQPLLPITKFPASSRINEEIEYVNDDGSTNIKGIYKDKDGLIIIKYNEIDDDTWEKIGFSKGTISKGIKTTTDKGEDVDTGNIKFLAHGLFYENELIKFDAFNLIDSDALLSVSYAERPESKYRFFKPQGVILDCDTKYIHGGGDTDSGSGYKKTIKEFKDNCIFGGYRQDDRNYISDLIKKALNLNDEEYIQFIKENENKPMGEIEPVELRDILIKAFASINSNNRNGSREYNEMYISNPKLPMAVFAYSIDENIKIDNPIEFFKRTTETPFERDMGKCWEIDDMSPKARVDFLRQYAVERDIPMVVFGE